MGARILSSIGVLAITTVIGSFAAASAAAQGPPRGGPPDRSWTPARTVNGRPDLRGVWANNGVTPLERPEAFKGREFLTDAEVEQLNKRAAELFDAQQAGDLIGDRLFQEIVKDPDLRPFDADTGNYNSFWLADRDFDNRTSLIVDPPGGRLPPRVKSADQSRRGQAQQQRSASGGPSGPEDLSLGVRCITYGVPWLVSGYNSYIQILQTTDYVAILQEMIHDVRIVPLDGRPHASKELLLWNGSSRGRWEGDTLVVTTTNYSPKTRLRGASENLRLEERFTRVAADVLEYRLTFDDPTTWTSPWTAVIRLKKTDDKIYEYACHEGNESMIGILSGARAQERAQSR